MYYPHCFRYMKNGGNSKQCRLIIETWMMIVIAALIANHLACQQAHTPDASQANVPADNLSGIPAAVQTDASWVSQQPEFLAVAERLEQSSNPYIGRQQLAILNKQLQQPGLAATDAALVNSKIWWHLLRLGETDSAERQIEKIFKMWKSIGNLPPEVFTELHRRRSLTYLRQAEVQNCINQHNRDCCIFPLRGGGIHQRKGAAREARRSLLAQLAAKPQSKMKGLSLIWLVNLTSMAIGDYPDGVPEQYRIPPQAFASKYDIQRFTDIAPALGVDTLNLCGGVIVDDFDGDSFLDIVTSTYDPRGPLAYYRNQGDGQFTDRSAASRLNDQLGGLNCVGADYDNDGDVDVLVLRGAWLQDDGCLRNSLLQNNGDGTFTDVTRRVGLAEPARPTQAAVWGDFDGDGNLDLYVGNEARDWTPDEDGDYPSQLFRNNADGTFTDIAHSSGVTNDRYAKGVTAGDFDNDGDLDLYVSNATKNRLYQNNGDGTFVDVAETLQVTGPPGRSFATWFFDYNNDGWLDLFVTAFHCHVSHIAADYLGQSQEGLLPCLYRNDGQGGFTDVVAEVGLDHPYLPMGANFGDLDNDGYLDIYLATGDPEYESLMPNIMLRNDGGNRFQDVTESGGFGHLQKGHGVAFADLDNDGDQDIYNQLGGFYPGDRFQNVLFQNPGHGNHFVMVKLVGTSTNRSGYGARIRVTVSNSDGLVTFHRGVGSVSSFGGSPLRQEIGIGDASKIEHIEIEWPTSGTMQTMQDVPLDSMIQVTEGEAGFQRLPLKSIGLVGEK